MPAKDPLTFPLTLEAAIDRRPLTVPPDTPVGEAIAIMSKAQNSCSMPGLELSRHTVLISEARASAILVVEGSALLGVFAERDAIQAIASGRNLAEVTVSEVMQRPAIALTQTDHQDIFAAVALLHQLQIEHLPVVDSQGHLVGMVTPASIRPVLQLDELLKAKLLSEIADPPVVQVPVTTSLPDLAQLMVVHQVDVVVLTEVSRDVEAQSGIQTPVGTILERHILQLWALARAGFRASTHSISHAPITPLLCCL